MYGGLDTQDWLAGQLQDSVYTHISPVITNFTVNLKRNKRHIEGFLGFNRKMWRKKSRKMLLSTVLIVP